MIVLAPIIFILLAIVSFVVYIKTPKAKYVIAGNVRKDLIPEKKDKRLRMLSTFKVGKEYINPRDYFIGIVDGSSMAPQGLLQNNMFFATENYDKPKSGDIFVLRTPEGIKHAGRLKLREIVSVKPNQLITQSYDPSGKAKDPSQHSEKDLVAKVLYVIDSKNQGKKVH